ncbi:MAG TPA: hypothetical protein VGC18_12060 [Lacisediminihabitans sp.]|uniref:hypothetical protein n=1 Tax=Lacisediminihabitans sp. TaxID=2787631 RepID=UPI002ED8A31A
MLLSARQDGLNPRPLIIRNGDGLTINFKLNDRFDIDAAKDGMGRAWVGWSLDLSDHEVYEQNRGIWLLGRRARSQEVATFSHHGEVVAVVAIERIEDIPSLQHQKPKQAIIGRVLQVGDADYDALIGQRVDHYRNPVTYLPTGLRTCRCGCGGAVAGSRAFLPGHDQRAIHDRIAQEWGTTLQFVEWFDNAYGKPGAVTADR